MLLDLKFSIGTLGLAAGTLVSALYGMNLKNFIEESDLGFGAVSATCLIFSAIVSVYGLMKLRKVQRVRMWGEGGMASSGIGALSGRSLAGGNRGNWRSDSIEPMLAGLPGEGRMERMKRLKENAAFAAAVSHAEAARRAMGRASPSAKESPCGRADNGSEKQEYEEANATASATKA
jgi:hypothetical protein